MPGELTIAAVLEHYGADLHRVRETGWRPLRCPFHDDRQASASVNLAINAYCCHGCGVKGSGLTLIMNKEGLGYHDAVEFAKGLGLNVDAPTRAKPKRKPPSRWRDKLFA